MLRTMRGEGAVGPKFGPKHRDTWCNQAVPDIIAGQREVCKNLHRMTKRYRSIRTPSYFKTGALDHSATLPRIPCFAGIQKRACSGLLQLSGRKRPED